MSLSGERFEILVFPDAALNYKLGRAVTSSEVVAFDEIYSDSSKGLRVSSEKLQKHFNTDDSGEVIEKILKAGELQLTTDQRRKMVDEKRKQIVQIISKNFVDPKSGIPHPPLRVEQALQDARVQIDAFKDADEQSKAVIGSIRTILPLKSERVRFEIVVPAQFASQSIGVLKGFGALENESWGTDGSFTTTIEIPAGVKVGLIDKLGSVTKGAAQATEIR